MKRKTRRQPAVSGSAGGTPSQAAKSPPAALVKVEPVADKIGESRGNLVARAAAFLRRRGNTKS